MSLRLASVSYSYARGQERATNAVSEIDLEIEPGTLTLIVGATGSGKSTLMRLAACLLEPDAGAIAIDGRYPALGDARGQVGLVFQQAETQLFADSVAEDVAFGPRNLGVDADECRARVDASLLAVGLDPGEFGHRSPFALSGGQARRAAIAGVLAMKPSYLLADEPTAGLDASGRTLVHDLLCEARKRAGVVVVSHAAEEFLGAADRVVVLRDGRVMWAGDARAAIDRPEVFIGAGIRPPDVIEVQRRLREAGISLAGLHLEPEAAAAQIESALRATRAGDHA